MALQHTLQCVRVQKSSLHYRNIGNNLWSVLRIGGGEVVATHFGMVGTARKRSLREQQGNLINDNISSEKWKNKQ